MRPMPSSPPLKKSSDATLTYPSRTCKGRRAARVRLVAAREHELEHALGLHLEEAGVEQLEAVGHL